MNVKDIVENYLQDNGYDGLCNTEQECGCRIDDLFACDSCPDKCQPGHIRLNEDGEDIMALGEDGDE